MRRLSSTSHTPHGDIDIPAFIPVGTKATVKALTPDQLSATGTADRSCSQSGHTLTGRKRRRVGRWVAALAAASFLVLAPRGQNATAPCIGNEQDFCITGPTVDLYPAGSEGAVNPELQQADNAGWLSIGGVVTDARGNTISLHTTSGRAFTVTFPVEIRSWWNTNIGPNYQGLAFGVGDTVRVDYVAVGDRLPVAIGPDQILGSALAIDLEAKGAADS
ncbi:hypothetical protein CR970_04345 [Candidatus Saccharibacteria bacterium]|nr:MAG: hypothetical protein CR970_04345 [Candidatus Saccharibacteria bacterium]